MTSIELLPIRLSPGADLRRALEEALRDRSTDSAFIVSGIGSLVEAKLRYAGEATASTIAGPLEVLGVSGTLSASGAHLHLSVSDASGRVYGGHGAYGNVIRTTAEILLALLPKGSLRRAPDPATGFDELVVAATPQPLYHGTRADLKTGDLIGPGFNSNYGAGRKANHVYFSGTLDAATWGAELAQGSGPGRIYLVEPTGAFADDPNLTDKKFPGNPTRSYRSRDPLRVIGEVVEWQGHSPEALKAMTDHIEQLKRLGVEAVDD